MNNVIESKELVKKYRKTLALDNINLNIKKGEIFGLLGPNGAGKSTFLSIITTLTKPSSGNLYVYGMDVGKKPKEVKKFLGYVPQEIALYDTLSGYDNLNFWAGIYRIDKAYKKRIINETIKIIGLEDKIKEKVKNYSGGMKRRLNIGVALIKHPEILILDEPTVGVDIMSRKCILEAFESIKKIGKTIIFASHYIDELEKLCDRIAIINKGKLARVGSVNDIINFFNVKNLEDIMPLLAK